MKDFHRVVQASTCNDGFQVQAFVKLTFIDASKISQHNITALVMITFKNLC